MRRVLYLVHVFGHFSYVQLVDEGYVGQALHPYGPTAPLDDGPRHILCGDSERGWVR